MRWSVSVIIPVYNRPEFVCRAIHSVLRQTRQPDEIIVVDDGSTDRTPAVLQQFESAVRLLRTPHRGVSHARNTGISHARGEWIAFLDSDDEWMPEKLEAQLDWLKSHPDIRVMQTDEIWVRHGRRVNPKKYHQKPEGRIFIPALKRCVISPSAVIIHRSVFDIAGKFDEDLPAAEDFDLWLRVSLRYRVGLLREPLVIKYGGHTDQLSRTIWGLDRYRIYALEKVLFKYPIPPDEKKEAILELIRKMKIFAEGSRKRGYLNTWGLYKRRMEYWQARLRDLEQ